LTASGDTDVLVIGAGLAGLAAALRLHTSGLTVRVLEADAIPGGRIRSAFDGDHDDLAGDLGPTWIWPEYQPVAARWLAELRLDLFDQHDDGLSIYEARPGEAPVRTRLPVQLGRQRVVGGTHTIIDALTASLPANALLTGCPVAGVSVDGSGVAVAAGTGRRRRYAASRVVFATPLRIASRRIDWQPALPGDLGQALEATPTWMAPHAKVVIRYDTPFWREAGLSGHVISHAGPLVEIHDHCGPRGEPAALFGFVGWPPAHRAERGSTALEDAIRAQLERCFGHGIPAPRSIHLQDWATSTYIATDLDLAGPAEHPEVAPEILRRPHRDGRVWFCVAETACRSPGLIEGAFDAADRTAAAMLRRD
jgi:monoamine oxidase